jgi:1-acyl-sn-glycerol-3-phosphate acyltransferase
MVSEQYICIFIFYFCKLRLNSLVFFFFWVNFGRFLYCAYLRVSVSLKYNLAILNLILQSDLDDISTSYIRYLFYNNHT